MNYIRKILLIILVFYPFYGSLAHVQITIDEIEQKLSHAFGLRNINSDSTMLLAKEAWAESIQLEYHLGIAKALGIIGIPFSQQMELDSAIIYFEKSLNYRLDHNLGKSGIAGMYTRIGNIYVNKGMFERGISYLNQALKIREGLALDISLVKETLPQRKRLLADAFSDLAIAHKNLVERKLRVNNWSSVERDLSISIVNYENSIKILKSLGRELDFADRCNMISSLYRIQSKYDSALYFLNQAERIFITEYNKDLNSPSRRILTGLSDTYTRKGRIYNDSGKPFSGTPFYEKALEFSQASQDSFWIFLSMQNLGDNALKKKSFGKALSYFRKAESLSKYGESDKELLHSLNNNLAAVYDSLGNHEKSLQYLGESLKLNMEISLESSNAQIQDATENIRLESENREKEIEAKYLRRQSTGFLIGGVLLTALLSIILYFSYQKQKYQKIVIENQEAKHTEHLLDQLEEAEQQILSEQSSKQEMMLSTIGKELHDSIGSMLSAAKREMENLKLNLADIPQKAETQFDHSYSLVDKAIRDLRRISKAPDKLSLDEQLLPSLVDLCKNINQIDNAPHIELHTYRLDGIKLPAKHELHIFRIIQEAIANIIKHAQATEVHLNLDWANRILSITIEDNGVGFDPKKITHGVGLNSMKSRTEEIGGTFTLDTAPGKGSTLFMEISIPS